MVSKVKSQKSWLLLIHQLPARPTNLRVRIWRKLQKLGAIAVKNSVYILPNNEKTREDFQWLKQEIESAGGEATVFRADSVEGASNNEIIEAFRRSSDEAFAIVTANLDGLTGTVREQGRGKHLSAGRLETHVAELEKLHAELERLSANDFFAANGRRAALKSFDRCQKSILTAQASTIKPLKAAKSKQTRIDPGKYQNRRWVTRRNLHIDRLASIWLIRQFIDKHPRFYFVAEDQELRGAIAFDMYGADFSHQGEDCTFETMLKQFRLGHINGLRELAEIVHDIDLKDGKFHRREAAGLNTVVNGLSQTLRNDRKLAQAANLIFDGLFSLLEERGKKSRSNDKRREKLSKKTKRSAR